MPNYKTTYAGKKLLEKHSLDTYGVWRIYGEDPNCDFGGHHHTPFLETVEGKLSDVIAYAEQLSGFYQWGGGGEIKLEPSTIKKIPEGYGDDTMKKEREDKKKALEDQMKLLQEQIEALS